MKDKKPVEEELFERRWLHHAKHEPAIFEADEIKKALKEGWKFWPWETAKKELKQKKSSVIEDINCSPIKTLECRSGSSVHSLNPEVTIVNDSLPVSHLDSTADKEEIKKCLQRQQPK